ncbi:MAG TPA: phosphatase [Gammaproteobacteria bacterium]|jgi:3-deoxy-D-manno-octulosonate 8-phosphate phosphatase (KDO 8-P phosphatase)|nr:phosphatase [Gammaproteobacteria bacterium]
MTHSAELESRFSKLGGVFVTPASVLAERVHGMRGLVSDWDGVFNQGAKGEGAESTYSEPDSMGTNLLRYALWRAHGRQMPIAALITGAENPSARGFALREHFHAIYYGARNKTQAIETLCRVQRVSSEHLICIFDDVNDLGMAFACGIRIFVQRAASPLLRDYVVSQGLCDYVTALPPERHAVREACELMLGLLGAFDAVVASRVAWDADYAAYFAARQAVATEFVDHAKD